MKKSAMTKWAVVMATALVLTACGARDQPDPGSEDAGDDYLTTGIFEQEVDGEPTSGGTLTLADWSESRSLDPSTASWTGYSAGTPMVAVYDQLVRWNERTHEFEPRLAESVTPNQDYTQWTIALRPGATFSDGTPVNADAVLGSFNYYFENHGYDLSVIAPVWGGAKKLDDLTIEVSLTDSWATFPFALGKGLGFIAAPAAIENGPERFVPIGAGPFTLDRYRPQEELVLTANADYWDGAPYLESLRFVWLGGDETKYEAMTAGSVDVTMFQDVELVKKYRDAGGSGWVATAALGNMININMSDGHPGENSKVREAVAHAIDEQALYDRVFDGLGTPSKLLFGPRSHWYNEAAEAPAHDVEKARGLVDEAKAEGFDGRIVLTSMGDPVSRDQALTLQAQLEAAGFTVENDFTRSVAENITKVYVDGDYDFSRSALTVDEADPYWRFMTNFYSSSPGNTSGFADPEFDALVEQLRTVQGDDRQDLLSRIEERFLTVMPHIALADTVALVAWSDDVHGVVPSNDSMLGFEKAWIGG